MNQPTSVIARAAFRTLLVAPVALVLVLVAGHLALAAAMVLGAAAWLFVLGAVEGAAARAAPGAHRALAAGVVLWLGLSVIVAGTEAQMRYLKRRRVGDDAATAAARVTKNAAREARRALLAAVAMFPLGAAAAARLASPRWGRQVALAAAGSILAVPGLWLETDHGFPGAVALPLGGVLVVLLLALQDELERRWLGTSVTEEAWAERAPDPVPEPAPTP